MFTHYGCITTRFFPLKSHGPLAASDLEATTLKHLAPFVDKLLLPRGIRAMNEWTVDMRRGQGNDPFSQVVGSYLTCQPVTPNSDDPLGLDQEPKLNAKPLGPSLDHVVAQQLSPDGTPLLLRVGNALDNPSSAISYSARETAYAGLGSVSELLGRLTNLFKGNSLSPDTYQAARGKSILDLVKNDLDTLQRFDMSQADKAKLEAWKTLLHETTSVMVSAQCNQDLARELALTEENLATASMGRAGLDRLTTPFAGALDGADLYSNLAVLAAICNLNPVIVLKYPANYVFSGLGITVDSATLARRSETASFTGNCYPNALELIHSIDDFYARKFARVVNLLNGISEGEGKVIDNVAAVWMQEVSDGLARNLNNLPIVQAGSLGGYFKTGWAVNVHDGSPDLSRGNSEAQCKTGTRYDARTQETGTDPGLATAPINKYYCNLMNALGVRAGADGFPAKGGDREVSKFGMYDRTEDFVHGGTATPRIHDPGEFNELKASA